MIQQSENKQTVQKSKTQKNTKIREQIYKNGTESGLKNRIGFKTRKCLESKKDSKVENNREWAGEAVQLRELTSQVTWKWSFNHWSDWAVFQRNLQSGTQTQQGILSLEIIICINYYTITLSFHSAPGIHLTVVAGVFTSHFWLFWSQSCQLLELVSQHIWLDWLKEQSALRLATC